MHGSSSRTEKKMRDSGVKEGQISSLVPEAAMDSFAQSLDAMDDLQASILSFISLADPDALSDLPPLARARAFISLASAASALLSVRLRCSGISPDNHLIKAELARISLYEDKLQKSIMRSKEPLRPSTKINPQAAARFIGHSLPDLGQDQRQQLYNISKSGGCSGRFSENQRSKKKRKSQTMNAQSVQDAAKEFLEKAARELLGTNDSVMKGPLRNDTSSDEDDVSLVNISSMN